MAKKRKKAPRGYHYMPDGTLMKNSAHKKKKKKRWVDLLQHQHWLRWLIKDQCEREEEMSKKRKRRKVPKDKATDLPKKYLSGLKGSKRSARASLIKTMSSLYKSGARIPASLFRMRRK